MQPGGLRHGPAGCDRRAALHFGGRGKPVNNPILFEKLADEVLAALTDMGHPVDLPKVSSWGREKFGRAQIIVRDPETGVLCADLMAARTVALWAGEACARNPVFAVNRRRFYFHQRPLQSQHHKAV